MNDYYIGLDVGTDSIGWAVTDTDYKISKFNGNAMWGIRLLEESKTAEERRNFRASRRRYLRSKYRIKCLEMLFDEEIAKKDIAFFQRLKESSYRIDDKSIPCKYSLFNDADYTDKDYFKEYPTIYHLRKELVESDTPHDVRLVYLAISHIINNRGHFLFDSDLGNKENLEFKSIWESLNQYLDDNYDYRIDCEDVEKLKDYLTDTTATKTKKKENIVSLLNLNKKSDKEKIALITLLSGGSAKANDLFISEEYNDDCKNICLSSGYDDNYALYESTFGEKIELIEKIKSVYDWAVLFNILKNEKYISNAKVKQYDKHNTDLKLLKAFINKYCPENKKLILTENKKGVCNYLAYSGHSKQSPYETNCNEEKFCAFLKKTLPEKCPDEKYQKMYDEIAAESFMPKIVTKDNSVIPMQINKVELIRILNNAKKYLPFLNEKNESGKTVSDKIIDIFSFKIPYYFGPLNTHSERSWVERTNEKIYPWNINEVVNADKSAENFINRLTSKCTYLKKEDVIPKCSLLYSSFTVLNELNNLRLDGEKISVELKQNIYNDLFMTHNKVTHNTLVKYLKSIGLADAVISGIDGDFKSNLKSYRDLRYFDLSNKEKEEIIKSITIFGDDKKLLKSRIKNIFGNKLSEDEIKKICSLKFAGWSRLSEKFLNEVEGCIKSTGEVLTIIHAMWETNYNLMQLLSSETTFVDSVNKENLDVQFTTLKNEVEALYVSPKVKRPIYQSMQIVDEIVKIKHRKAPKKIFVEVARGEEEKVRKASRKDKLVELYKSCKQQQTELFELLQNYSENDLRRDALYLYFTQFGKSMYSGKPINIEDIFNHNICDIDHIFPQSKIKDDSINNRVLVFKTENEKKTNIYPIDSKIRENQRDFWKMLLDKGFIEQTKYDRLTRNTPLTDEELSSFISRQLVETRQSTKAIAQLLEKVYPKPETEIVYVKAGLVSDFRHEHDFVKSREVNDLHHAKDAYLNIVVGNVYNTQFNHNPYYLKGLQNGEYSMSKLFDYPVKNAWITKGKESIKMVEKMMNKNNILYTRYSYKQKGGLFDQNILKAGSGQVPQKKNTPLKDIDHYGGYNRATSTYFAVVDIKDNKNKTIRRIVPIDLYKEKEYFANPEKFIKELLEVNEVNIVVPCLKYNALVSVDGFRMHISSKSNGGKTFVCKPAVQLILGKENEKYIKNISNYLKKCTELRKVKEITPFDKLTNEENISIYDAITDKLLNTVFKNKFSRLGNILVTKKPLFEKLNVNEQCTVIMEILNILHADTRTGDLSLIGEPKKAGVTSLASEIKSDSFKIINQSITGLFETEIDITK